MARRKMPKDLRRETRIAFLAGRELGDAINQYIIEHRSRSLGAAMRAILSEALGVKET